MVELVTTPALHAVGPQFDPGWDQRFCVPSSMPCSLSFYPVFDPRSLRSSLLMYTHRTATHSLVGCPLCSATVLQPQHPVSSTTGLQIVADARRLSVLCGVQVVVNPVPCTLVHTLTLSRQSAQ